MLTRPAPTTAIPISAVRFRCDAEPRPAAPTGCKNGLQFKWSAAEQQYSYYFVIRKADADAGFKLPKGSKVLGSDQAAAQRHVDEVLRPMLDKFRAGIATLEKVEIALPGTLFWMIEEFLQTRWFLGERNRKGSAPVVVKDGKETRKLLRKHLNRKWHIYLIANFELSDGRRVGDLQLTEITPLLREKLFEALLCSERKVWDEDQKVWLNVERLTTRNKAFRYMRACWNHMYYYLPKLVPALNPFSHMGIVEEYGEVPAATRQELDLFVLTADELGFPSVGTAVWIAWEWIQRGEHVLGDFYVTDYRPPGAENYAYVRHEKTKSYVWMPLNDATTGEPIFPELTSRLDAAAKDRTDGLMIVRDRANAKSKATAWISEGGYSSAFGDVVRLIIEKAGLRSELSFRSFRNGGFTEMGEAKLTDTQIRHYSRHLSSKVLESYVKRTALGISVAQQDRRAHREEQKLRPDPILSGLLPVPQSRRR